MRLKDKVAIVTGAARGIGKEIAFRLAQEGAKIAIVDINIEQCNAAKVELEKAGYQAVAIKCDVSNRAEVEKMVENAVNAFGTVDILVNNAGITADSLLEKMTDDKWNAVLSVNLTSVFLCSQAVIKHMKPKLSGKIISLSSVSGERGNVGQANYSASKAGIIGLTKTLAKELAKKNINVNAIAPGFIDSEMTKKIPEQVRLKLIENIPMGKSGQPLDVANACLFLASEESNYITGQVLRVNGGSYL